MFGGWLSLFHGMIVLRRCISSWLIVREGTLAPPGENMARDEDGDGAAKYMVSLGCIGSERMSQKSHTFILHVTHKFDEAQPWE